MGNYFCPRGNKQYTMRTLVFISFFLMSGVVALAQNANTTTPTTDARELSQRARIHEGRKSGELTNKEARRLSAQQRHIRRTERKAKADGNVSPQEKRKLRREQNRASRNIRRQKHDTQTKPGVKLNWN